MATVHSFRAVVQIAGINPYVDVPPRAAEALGGGGKIAVLVKVAAARKRMAKPARSTSGKRLKNDATQLQKIARLAPDGWFRTTLVATRSGGHRLYLDMWMRDEAGVSVNDEVRISLKADRAQRHLPVPALLREALENNPRAKAAWEKLSASRQREILTYLNFLKSQAALERNVQKTIAGLLAHKRAAD